MLFGQKGDLGKTFHIKSKLETAFCHKQPMADFPTVWDGSFWPTPKLI